MLLDTGTFVFLWKGPTASIIEVKFAAKSAEVCLLISIEDEIIFGVFIALYSTLTYT
jgi:hypothetical protein